MTQKSSKDKTYQQLKEELDEILQELQHEQTDIDRASELHKRGKQLIAELEKYLGRAAKSLDVK